jgi:hypothetical protein
VFTRGWCPWAATGDLLDQSGEPVIGLIAHHLTTQKASAEMLLDPFLLPETQQTQGERTNCK